MTSPPEADDHDLNLFCKLAHAFRRDAWPTPNVLNTLGGCGTRIERAC